jgi:hypothetical protein
MELETNPLAIARRIRRLIGGHDPQALESAARRLGVDEQALRISVDDVEPEPTIDVLKAVVREYGVDPTWLITGEHDASSHRLADAKQGRAEITNLVSPSTAPPSASTF